MERFKLSNDQLTVIYDCIQDYISDCNTWPRTRGNLYLLDAIDRMEKKVMNKVYLTRNAKTLHSWKMTLCEMVTLKDVLSRYNKDPQISGFYMQLDSKIPPFEYVGVPMRH